MKKIYIIMITLFALLASSWLVFTWVQQKRSGYIDGRDAVRVMYAIEAANRLEKFTKNIHFAYDSSVLPSASYAALDSIIGIIRTYESEKFRYVFRVHTHQGARNADEELVYSMGMAEAIKQYVLNAGIATDFIETKGVGRKEIACSDQAVPDCFHLNNRLEIQVD